MPVPPCLCCGHMGEDGADAYDLFQSGKTQPCAWAHQQCFAERLARHASRTQDGIKLGKVCIVCEQVTDERLLPLQGTPGDAILIAIAWVHLGCIAKYGDPST